MRTSLLSVSRGVFVLMLIGLVFLPACTCSERSQSAPHPILACKVQGKAPKTSPPLQSKTIVPGALETSFEVTQSGDASLSLPLPALLGRAGQAPDIALQYGSANEREGLVGVGFSLHAGSSIQRCANTMAIDLEMRAIQFDKTDAYCLDGKRLVVVNKTVKTIEYRTIPDSQIKVVQYLDGPSDSHFEVFLPDGSRILYGANEWTRPMANTGEPLVWLAEEKRDPRGNTITYDWCFAEDESGYVAEYALTSIRYAPDRAVVFSYDPRADARTTYRQGMQLQQSLTLAAAQMQAAGS